MERRVFERYHGNQAEVHEIKDKVVKERRYLLLVKTCPLTIDQLSSHTSLNLANESGAAIRSSDTEP